MNVTVIKDGKSAFLFLNSQRLRPGGTQSNLEVVASAFLFLNSQRLRRGTLDARFRKRRHRLSLPELSAAEARKRRTASTPSISAFLFLNSQRLRLDKLFQGSLHLRPPFSS